MVLFSLIIIFCLELEVVVDGLVHESTELGTDTASRDSVGGVEHVNALGLAIVLGPGRAAVASRVGVAASGCKSSPAVHNGSGEGSIGGGPGVGRGVVHERGASKDKGNIVTVADMGGADIASGAVGVVAALELVLVDGGVGSSVGLGNELGGADPEVVRGKETLSLAGTIGVRAIDGVQAVADGDHGALVAKNGGQSGAHNSGGHGSGLTQAREETVGLILHGSDHHGDLNKATVLASNQLVEVVVDEDTVHGGLDQLEEGLFRGVGNGLGNNGVLDSQELIDGLGAHAGKIGTVEESHGATADNSGSSLDVVEGKIDGVGLGNGSAEKILGGNRHRQESADGVATSRLTKNGDLGLVTTEAGNVVLDPLQGNEHITDTLVSGESRAADTGIDTLQETEETETVVDGDDDNLATGSHVGGVESGVGAGTSGEGTSVQAVCYCL